ncbi:MAG: phenylalanine--tRNA ligase beta subunit-related protein [Pseudomonadota bacterium]
MRFSYSPYMQETFPERVSGILTVAAVDDQRDVAETARAFLERARRRLADESEGTFPEIQAWRRAYATMGLKPTQYRCAAESLLRRFRKEGSLPDIHPLVDLCNAVSLANAVPIAVFDRDKIEGDLIVREAEGTEIYLTFSGETETPESGEVIFADAVRHAHARRWANRQSRHSAVSRQTRRALIVAEALHAGAAEDIARLAGDLGDAIAATFGERPESTLLLSPEAFYDSTDNRERSDVG